MLKRFLCLLLTAALLSVSPALCTEKTQMFEDITPASPYYEAILWASEHGVADGVDSTHFSPSGQCDRAHILTFIWRASGSPSNASRIQPFEDIAGRYYENAASWAYVNGYETGEQFNGKVWFNGDTPCTRAMAMVYLWNLAGRPAANPDDALMFYDVSSSQSSAALQAVAWAVSQGITLGTSAYTFSPEKVCTRGQIVTFLYRYNKLKSTE